MHNIEYIYSSLLSTLKLDVPESSNSELKLNQSVRTIGNLEGHVLLSLSPWMILLLGPFQCSFSFLGKMYFCFSWDHHKTLSEVLAGSRTIESPTVSPLHAQILFHLFSDASSCTIPCWSFQVRIITLKCNPPRKCLNNCQAFFTSVWRKRQSKVWWNESFVSVRPGVEEKKGEWQLGGQKGSNMGTWGPTWWLNRLLLLLPNCFHLYGFVFQLQQWSNYLVIVLAKLEPCWEDGSNTEGKLRCRVRTLSLSRRVCRSSIGESCKLGRLGSCFQLCYEWEPLI